jgi:hypothetical protein
MMNIRINPTMLRDNSTVSESTNKAVIINNDPGNMANNHEG